MLYHYTTVYLLQIDGIQKKQWNYNTAF